MYSKPTKMILGSSVMLAIAGAMMLASAIMLSISASGATGVVAADNPVSVKPSSAGACTR